MFKKHNDPQDFCIINSKPEFRLSAFERLTLTGGAELEKAIQWFAKQLGSFSYAKHLNVSVDIAQVLDGAKFYESDEWRKNPEKFFIAPEKAPHVTETLIHGLNDGEIVDIAFDSQYKVQNPVVAAAWGEYKENNRVQVRMWRHSKQAKCTIVAIHGWTMGDQRLNSLAFLPGVFYREGADVAIIELPFHGRRKCTSQGGVSLFPSADLSTTNEAMGQIISDLRGLAMYLRGCGAREIGCIGMSLGGYIGALWASLDPLAFCIPIVPMVSMAELAWEFLTRDPAFSEFREKGLSLDLMRSMYHVHSPLIHAPKIPNNRLMIIAGIGDEIVPARQPKMLWDHWKRPRISWLGGGHVAQMKRSKAFTEIFEFLGSLGVLHG